MAESAAQVAASAATQVAASAAQRAFLAMKLNDHINTYVVTVGKPCTAGLSIFCDRFVKQRTFRQVFRQTLPTQFVEFVQMIHGQAKGRALIGWGCSRGAKCLIEMVWEHAVLDATAMFAGYPQSKCEHEKRACAQELMAIRSCGVRYVKLPILLLACRA